MNVKASNISVVSFDLSKASVHKLVINSQNIPHASIEARTIWLEQDTNRNSTGWKVTSTCLDDPNILHDLLE